MDEERVREKLVAHCYTPEGKSRGARLGEPYLRKNGFNSEVDFVLSVCSGIVPNDYLFSRKLSIFCKDRVYVPHCKTCGVEYFQWSSKKNDWSEFCSQKCIQNDPEVKARNQYGQRDVNWGKTIDKRKITMQEKYGVESWSQLDESKQDFVIRTKEASIKNKENKITNQIIDESILNGNPIVIVKEQNVIDVVSPISKQGFYEFIFGINPTAIQSYNKLFEFDIDVFMAEKNLGIMFNGTYWNSEAEKSYSYNRERVEYFHSKGIRIVQIWEDDWNNKPEVVKKFIKNLLNDNKDRIGARKTKVVNLSKTEYESFMNENHMQGKTSSSVRLGLEYEGNIVSAMGFKNIPVNIKPVAEGIGYELNRFANTNVTGAFTKLLSYFEKNHEVDFITSFGDMEIVSMDSNVYTKNGFSEIYRIREDYRYYDYRTDKREHKFNFRKSRFSAIGYNIENKTETELAKEHKLLRTYDSGKIQYLKKLK